MELIVWIAEIGRSAISLLTFLIACFTAVWFVSYFVPGGFQGLALPFRFLTRAVKSKPEDPRPWFWRQGIYRCSGECKAEFPNAHFRNAHDVRFHPTLRSVESFSTYREPAYEKIAALSFGESRRAYLVLCVKGCARFLADLPLGFLILFLFFVVAEFPLDGAHPKDLSDDRTTAPVRRTEEP